MIIITWAWLHSKTFRPLNIAFVSRIFWKSIFRSVIFWTIVCYLNFLCWPRWIDRFMINRSISFKSLKTCSLYLFIIILCFILSRPRCPLISSIFILSSNRVRFWKISFFRVIVSRTSVSGQRFSIVKSFQSHLVLGSFLYSRGNIVVCRRRQVLLILLKTCVFPNAVVFSTLCSRHIIGSRIWVIRAFWSDLFAHYFK